MQNHLKYDSYGKVTSESNAAVDHLFAFTGRERDEETGLQYHRARYLDVAVGRWVSEDPTGFLAGDASITRYVGNSPVHFTDPTGLFAIIPWVRSTVPTCYFQITYTTGVTQMRYPITGSTPEQLRQAFDTISQQSGRITGMILKGHGGVSSDDTFILEECDGRIFLEVDPKDGQIYTSHINGNRVPITQQLIKLTQPTCPSHQPVCTIALRGCDTASMAETLNIVMPHTSVTGTLTQVVNVPFTPFYIGP